jgi:hypothetical protein
VGDGNGGSVPLSRLSKHLAIAADPPACAHRDVSSLMPAFAALAEAHIIAATNNARLIVVFPMLRRETFSTSTRHCRASASCSNTVYVSI